MFRHTETRYLSRILSRKGHGVFHLKESILSPEVRLDYELKVYHAILARTLLPHGKVQECLSRFCNQLRRNCGSAVRGRTILSGEQSHMSVKYVWLLCGILDEKRRIVNQNRDWELRGSRRQIAETRNLCYVLRMCWCIRIKIRHFNRTL